MSCKTKGKPHKEKKAKPKTKPAKKTPRKRVRPIKY